MDGSSLSSGDTEIYDALAPHYREYAARKSAYLAAVDRFILSNVPYGARSLLDVGAGDGIRGMGLARVLEIDTVVLCDVSPEMLRKCKELEPLELWQAAAESLPATELRFDVVVCLWNVLGHVRTRTARVQALTRMREVLSDRGLIFLDVNNRHNASAYGAARVIGRVILDFVRPDERRGDATFDWKIGKRNFPAMGHLFTPGEIARIIDDGGLIIKKRASVDYVTGEVSRCRYRGQMLFMLGKQ